VVALIPAAFLVAISLYRPVSLEPRLTMAGNSSSFLRIVASSGGINRVQGGFYLDFVFIAVFSATVPALLYAGHGWWLVPTLAAVFDITEDVLALVLLHHSGAPMAFKILWAVAAVKLATYAGTTAAIGAAAYRNR